MAKKDVQEMFAIPVGLRHVANVDGIPLYSSKSLKIKYVKAMSKVKNTKPIVSTISKLVEKGEITPCWLSKGLFRLTAFKIFAPAGIKTIKGFFYPPSNKIYLLIDNNMVFGFSSNRFLAVLTVHEGMHMFAKKHPSTFLSIFGDDLAKFYSFIFDKIFKLEGKKIKELDSIIKFLFRNLEGTLARVSNPNPLLVRYYNILDKALKPYSSLDENEFKKILTAYIVVAKIYLKDVDMFLRVQRKFGMILSPLYEAYRRQFKAKNLGTICVQELVYPSEVIAVLSEVRPSSKVYRAFKAI